MAKGFYVCQVKNCSGKSQLEGKCWGHYLENNHEVDLINAPPHHLHGGIETIDFIEAKGLGYHLGNVVKYIARAGHKDDLLQDLKKARWYLDRYIQKLEK